MTVQRHPDPVAHDAIQRAVFDGTVQIGAAGIDVIHNLGRIACQIHHHAVHGHCTGDTLGLSQTGMLAQVTVLAVHRDQHLRLDDIVHPLQVRPVCMPRHVIQAGAVINHVDPFFRELVDDADNTPFVARNGFGREQEEVALFHLYATILAARQLRRGRTPFALATGHDQHQIVARQLLRGLNADHLGKALQDTRFGGGIDHPLHGPSQQDNGPPGGVASLCQRLHTRDV